MDRFITLLVALALAVCGSRFGLIPTPRYSQTPAETAETAEAPDDALVDLIRQAEDGDVMAQMELGSVYFAGAGVAQDEEAAVYCFSMAAGRARYTRSIIWA